MTIFKTKLKNKIIAVAMLLSLVFCTNVFAQSAISESYKCIADEDQTVHMIVTEKKDLINFVSTEIRNLNFEYPFNFDFQRAPSGEIYKATKNHNGFLLEVGFRTAIEGRLGNLFEEHILTKILGLTLAENTALYTFRSYFKDELGFYKELIPAIPFSCKSI